MTTPTQPDARNSLAACVTIGLILSVVGGIVAAVAWPGTEANLITGELEDTGNGWVTLLGALGAWAGSALMFVGLVGFGVKLGREASPHVAASAHDG